MSAIYIHLTSFYPDRVDYSAKEVVKMLKREGSLAKGPIPLPNKTRKLTVLTSPHVDKDARDQFQTTRHKRLIIVDSSSISSDVLNKIELPPDVGVDIEKIDE